MKKSLNFESISIGLAMFSMFFGAGNVIFPLAIGQIAGDKNFLAIFGLIITAVIMPFAGVFGMILYDGNLRGFFGRLGRIPGFLTALAIITLLGPLGSTPRCIALTYSSLKTLLPSLSPVFFSAFSCLVIFFFSYKKTRLLGLLGNVLTPLLLISLGLIVAIGLLTPATLEQSDHNSLSIFIHGLKEGYNTMDLLAAFFFSSTILALLKQRSGNTQASQSKTVKLSLQAAAVGATLLALVYIGFSYIAAFHGGDLAINSKDELLSALIIKIAGPSSGLLVCITIALACLTTAIALISVFSDFVERELFKGRLRYEWILALSLLVTFYIATMEFNGISAFLGPVLQICYPALIVLTLLNIGNKFFGIETVKGPVFLTLLITLGFYL